MNGNVIAPSPYYVYPGYIRTFIEPHAGHPDRHSHCVISNRFWRSTGKHSSGSLIWFKGDCSTSYLSSDMKYVPVLLEYETEGRDP